MEWLVPSTCQLAVDLGAGTGGLTRLLLAKDTRVIAVDPDYEMLRVLTHACPTAGAVQGTGENLPVKTATADAVVVSSAWHWIHPDTATREIERVLRPGGVFGIVYNKRDVAMSWICDIEQFLRNMPLVARLGAANPAGNKHSPAARERSDRLLTLPLRGAFARPRTTRIGWTKPMTPAEVAGFFISYYGVLCLPSRLRDELAAQLNSYISEHPVLRGREHIDFPMISTCWQTRRSMNGVSSL